MKLVRVGKFGINVDNVLTWTSSIDPDQAEEHEILTIVFVGGVSTLKLRDEQAIAFREWLERNSDDAA